MLLYAIVGIAVMLWLAVELGFMASPLAATVIQVRAGQVRLEKGNVSSSALQDVAAILSEAGILEGYITVTGNRVAFSRLIPSDAHQRLRNVLLNRLR